MVTPYAGVHTPSSRPYAVATPGPGRYVAQVAEGPLDALSIARNKVYGTRKASEGTFSVRVADDRTDVLIVGAGPSGMVAAVLLAQLGVSVRIVERHPSRLRFPKAHVISPVSLDICARAGFAVPAMIGAAAPPERDHFGRFRVRLLGEEIGAIPFEVQSDAWVPRPRINLAQPRFESILEWKLQVLPGIDYLTGRWLGMRQDGDSASSVIAHSDGERTYRSRYVIGADGAASAVRQAAGITISEFGAGRDRISVHIAADLGPWLADSPAGLYWVLDPEVKGTFIAHNIDDEWVYVFDPEGPETRTPEYIHDRVRKAIGADVPFEILGISPWVMSCEVADRFSEGNVFLVGDAAHRLPPTGGLGMNTGIQDVENLAWKLAAVVRGWAGESILETYTSERMPVGVTNAQQSRRNASSMDTLLATIGAAISDDHLDELAPQDIATMLNDQWDHLNSPSLQFGYTYAADAKGAAEPRHYTPCGAVGHRLPHTRVHEDGRSAAIVDRVGLDSYTLFVNGMSAAYEEYSRLSSVPIRIVDVRGMVADDWLRLVDLEQEGAAIAVRPDSHIIAKCPRPHPKDWDTLARCLTTYSCGDTPE